MLTIRNGAFGLLILGAVTLALVLSGCPSGQQTGGGTGAASAGIPVLISEDLAKPVEALKAAFIAKNPGAKLDFHAVPYKNLVEMATGQNEAILITRGPAELVPIDQKARLAAGSQIILADLPLVIVVKKGALKSVCNMVELGYPHIKKIALGDKDSGSIGAEAEAAIRKAKLWPKVKDRVVRVPLEKLVDAVATGQVDCAIVGGQMLDDRVTIGCDVPEAMHSPIEALAVRTVGFKPDRQADAFLKFLQSPAGQKPFVDAGLNEHLSATAKAGALFEFCGAGLREANEDLIKAFKAKTGIIIEPTYTGSGCLLAQITLSQQGDLYLPGEDYYMSQAHNRGYVTESRIVTYFVPVIMVQKGNPKGIKGLQDLLKPGLRVGIGEAKSTAIGDFTVKVMAANGISMDTLKKNVVSSFATAPEMGTAIKLGSVDATIQWDAVASWYLDDAEVVAFPTNEKTISSVPLGILKFSQHPDEARKFLEFVSGPEGQAIFKKHGHTNDPKHPTFPPQGAATN